MAWPPGCSAVYVADIEVHQYMDVEQFDTGLLLQADSNDQSLKLQRYNDIK